MTEASEEPTYEFDVAVSFAGEDRELVEEIVSRFKGTGVHVFYDTDYQADMWGEDLVEYLDQVYRVKARYAIMFVSRFYAEKMWTRHERRSALARALEQRSAYILPVRLDSTALDGLPPTVGYLDARLIGPDGIVSATLAKLRGTPPAQPAAITRVPRTEAERQQVLLMRPRAWEFLYFAGQLLHERNSVEAKYRDHEIQYAAVAGEVVRRADIANYISRRTSDASRLARKITSLVSDKTVQERAFGAPGQTGDPDRIAHLAKRWNSVYEEFMDWAASLRGASVPSEYDNLLELLARYSDGPVEQYRMFVDEFVAKVDAVPAALAAGNEVRLEMALVVSIPDEVETAYEAEFNRLEKQHEFDMTDEE
jgi:TIR domain